MPTRRRLPPTDRDVDEQRFPFGAARAPPEPLRGHDRDPGAAKRIKNDVVAARAVLDRVRQERGRDDSAAV